MTTAAPLYDRLVTEVQESLRNNRVAILVGGPGLGTDRVLARLAGQSSVIDGRAHDAQERLDGATGLIFVSNAHVLLRAKRARDKLEEVARREPMLKSIVIGSELTTVDLLELYGSSSSEVLTTGREFLLRPWDANWQLVVRRAVEARAAGHLVPSWYEAVVRTTGGHPLLIDLAFEEMDELLEMSQAEDASLTLAPDLAAQCNPDTVTEEGVEDLLWRRLLAERPTLLKAVRRVLEKGHGAFASALGLLASVGSFPLDNEETADAIEINGLGYRSGKAVVVAGKVVQHVVRSGIASSPSQRNSPQPTGVAGASYGRSAASTIVGASIAAPSAVLYLKSASLVATTTEGTSVTVQLTASMCELLSVLATAGPEARFSVADLKNRGIIGVRSRIRRLREKLMELAVPWVLHHEYGSFSVGGPVKIVND